MNRIFGYGNKKLSDQLLQESSNAINQAQQSLMNRVSQLDTQICQLNSQLQGLQKRINNTKNSIGQAPLKQRALKLLTKRKQLESMKDSLESQSWSMTQAQMTSDNLINTMVTVDALKKTNIALKQQYGKINVDKIQDMQDEMIDLIEQGEQLQEILTMNGENIDNISESELDIELQALEESELNVDFDFADIEINHNQSYPTNVPQFIDEEPEVDPKKLETVV